MTTLPSLRQWLFMHRHEHHVKELVTLNKWRKTVELDKVDIDRYTFVSSVNAGFNRGINGWSIESRAKTTVAVDIVASGGATSKASREVELLGPGDVLSLDRAQIVRRYPNPGQGNVECTALAHIEFDRPELPWAFTPTAGSEQLQPWLTLVVVPAHAVTWTTTAKQACPSARVPLKELPSLDDATKWAHAQAHQVDDSKLTANTRLSQVFAHSNLSRIMARRVLKPDTHYVAMVVPRFDAGVKVATQQPGTLDPAWAGNDGEIALPVYDHWEFRTGPEGDFATLSKKLRSVVAPPSVGRRTIDTSTCGVPLPAWTPGEDGRRQTIKCALFSSDPPGAPKEKTWAEKRMNALIKALNETSAQVRVVKETDADADLPIVGPRLYGRTYRPTPFLESSGNQVKTDWYEELNLTIAHRVVAGLGTRVVQDDQEHLMQAAWLQVGAVQEANARLARAQLMQLANERLHSRIATMPLAKMLPFVEPLADKIQSGAQFTLAGQIANSQLSKAAIEGAGRKALRPTGPLGRHIPSDKQIELTAVIAKDDKVTDFTKTVGKLTAATLKKGETGPVTVGDHIVAGKVDLSGLTWDKARPEIVKQEIARLRASLNDQDTAGLWYTLWTISGEGGVSDNVPELKELRQEIQKKLGNMNFSHSSQIGTELAQFLSVSKRTQPPLKAKDLADLLAGKGPTAMVPPDCGEPLPTPQEPVVTDLRPAGTIRDALGAIISTPAGFTRTRDLRSNEDGNTPWFEDGVVKPVMAAPNFERPMYKALDSYDREWLVPGLKDLGETNLVTVLEANAAFVEAYMVGLSDEMGRELLWRDYPTDLRGTYFKKFWGTDVDVPQGIHEFDPKQPLGWHVRGGKPTKSNKEAGDGRAVVLVRGEVVRRYPDLGVAVVQALTAVNPPQTPSFPTKVVPGQNAAAPMFRAYLDPDILLVGFHISVKQLREASGNWWVMIHEHPSAPRFASTAGKDAVFETASASNSANEANARLKLPVRVAWRATKFLQNVGGKP